MRFVQIAAVAACLLPAGCETGSAEDFGRVLGDVLAQSGIEQGNAGSELSIAEIDAGLRQALEIGIGRVANQIGVVDGYWNDPRIQIELPGRLGDVQQQLARVGLSGPLDDVQLRMNRAAESAVPAGKAIVVSAVKGMTIDDALSILRGGDTAATDFLRRKTEANLRSAFTPYVDSALADSGAYRALDDVTSSQPLLAVAATDYKSSLTTHAVQFGLNGMFSYLADEEKKIRENPVARTTELLRKVFGS